MFSPRANNHGEGASEALTATVMGLFLMALSVTWWWYAMR